MIDSTGRGKKYAAQRAGKLSIHEEEWGDMAGGTPKISRFYLRVLL